ncbi:hypothetical protein [Yoonia sp.]|uniref:hypothetical protein n=1 Tax=Yoonia sp. TaxID=2212373 RepID=UPI0025CC598C|nr:hypothetical protein [Yoonia sp.]
MHIAFLHTADAHVATFDALLAAQAAAIRVTHRVRPDLLDRARADGLDTVRDETLRELTALSGADAVVCTCSTLGPIADAAATDAPHVLRIDRPLMQAGCANGPNIAVAICLASTRNATLALLHDCATQPITPQIIMCADAWPWFEAGNMAGFAASIADTINAALIKDTTCVILAQASMAVAAPLLQHTGLPVLSSPALATERAISVARQRRLKPAPMSPTTIAG